MVNDYNFNLVLITSSSMGHTLAETIGNKQFSSSFFVVAVKLWIFEPKVFIKPFHCSFFIGGVQNCPFFFFSQCFVVVVFSFFFPSFAFTKPINVYVFTIFDILMANCIAIKQKVNMNEIRLHRRFRCNLQVAVILAKHLLWNKTHTNNNHKKKAVGALNDFVLCLRYWNI